MWNYVDPSEKASPIITRAGRADRLRTVAPVAAGLVVAIGLLVMTGWAVGSRAMTSVVPGMISMKVNTALSLILLAVALWGLPRPEPHWRVLRRACLIVVTLLALGTLAEYVFTVDLRIDNLLFYDHDSPKFPGRNAPATNVAFLGLVAAFVLVDLDRAITIAQALLIVVSVTPLASLGGYLYRTPGMYQDVPYPTIALNTSVALMFLCVGGLFVRPGVALVGVVTAGGLAGSMSRKLLPLAVGLPVLTGLLVLVGQRAGAYSPAFGAALLVAFCSIFFSAAVIWSATLLRHAERQREMAEEALHGNERLVRAIIDHAPAVIYVKDTEGRYLLTNARHEELFGVDAGELIGRTSRDLLPEAAANVVSANDQRVLGTGEPIEFEEVMPRADGQRTFLSLKFPVWNGSDRPIAVGGISTDITERKRGEDELRQAKDAAEAANKAKDHLLSVVSHELRTPLNPILGIASSLRERAELPPDVRDDMETIRRNVEHEARLIDDLLNLTRLQRGKIILHPEVVDLHVLLGAVVGQFKSQAAEKGVEIVTALHARPHQIWADAGRMQQVLANLIDNALKFTPPRGTIRVVTSDAPPGRVRVEIADTGVGVEASVLSRLFTPFEQGEKTTTRQFGGLGLGLVIVKGIVDLHKGNVTVRSDGRDRGTTVTLEFDAMAEPSAGQAAPAAPAPAKGNGRRILLVEDHPDTLKLMSRLLKSRGYVVLPAANVKEAVETIAREEFDLLISDIGLPDGSGLDVMRDLRARRPTPGIAVSGFGHDDDLRRSKDAGFAEHVVKPVNLQMIENAIRLVLG